MHITVGHGVRQTARAHIAVHPAIAAGGVLLGDGDGDGETVHVRSLIPAFTAPAPGQPVAVTGQEWTAIRGELRRHPDERIVGWYVSRRDGEPRLSAEVIRLHRAHFDAPGPPAVLLVLDAPAGESWFSGSTLQRVDRRHVDPPDPTFEHGRPAHVALRWQRAACALAGIGAGVAIWAAAIHTGTRVVHPAAAGAPAHAHPIVVEPPAGGGTP